MEIQASSLACGGFLLESPSAKLVVERSRDRYRVRVGKSKIDLHETEIPRGRDNALCLGGKQGRLQLWQDRYFRHWFLEVTVEKLPLRSRLTLSMRRITHAAMQPPAYCLRLMRAAPRRPRATLRALSRDLASAFVAMKSPRARISEFLAYCSWLCVKRTATSSILIRSDARRYSVEHQLVLRDTPPEFDENWDLVLPKKLFASPNEEEEETVLWSDSQDEQKKKRNLKVLGYLYFAVAATLMTSAIPMFSVILIFIGLVFIFTILLSPVGILCILAGLLLPLAHIVVLIASWMSFFGELISVIGRACQKLRRRREVNR